MSNELNREGNYINFKIKFDEIESLRISGSGVCATVNGFSAHYVFEQLSAAEIVGLIPDQSTLKEVKDILNAI